MNAASAANRALLDRVEQEPEQLEDDPGREWALTTRGLARTKRETLSSLGEMVGAIRENAGIARVLREPSRRVTAALDRLSSVRAVADEWDRRLQALGVPEPPEDWEPEEDEDAETGTP